MEILTIDIGNSSVKFGFFKDGRNCEPEVFEYNEIEGIPSIEAEIVVYSAVSSVKKAEVIKKVKGDKIEEINPERINSLKFEYNPLSSLGKDRIAAGLGAFKIYGGNSLIVDFGTAITVDYIDDRGVFKGGMIFPGPQSILDCLKMKTDKVKVEKYYPYIELGNSTENSVCSAITNAILGMIERKINGLLPKNLVFTGGYYSLFKEMFEETKIIEDRWLVLKGLFFYGKERFK